MHHQIRPCLHCRLVIQIPITTFIISLYATVLADGKYHKQIVQVTETIAISAYHYDDSILMQCFWIFSFEVDERSGVVRTRGTDLFQLDMEYVLYVKAEDQNGKVDDRRFQSTPEERLSIVGGKRAPQFYMPSYEAEIPENQKKDSE